MRNTIIIGIILMLVFVVGCSEPVQENDNNIQNGNVIDEEGIIHTTTTTMKLEEDKGIFTDTIKFGEDDQFQGKVIKNKLSKTASIELKMFFSDDEEYFDIFGEKSTMVPTSVNLMCGLFSKAYFGNESENNELTKMDKENNLVKLLEGYTVNKYEISFRDNETKEEIAKCVGNGAEWSDIKFYVYRDYSNVSSYMNQEIGVDPSIETEKDKEYNNKEIVCPNIETDEEINFKFLESEGIKKILIDKSYLNNAKFSKGWELSDKIYNDYPFGGNDLEGSWSECNSGKNEGESIYKLYCHVYLTLDKKHIDADGIVQKVDNLFLNTIIVDTGGQEYNNIKDFKTLKLDSYECSDGSDLGW